MMQRLHRPYSRQAMSDDVIGTVVQRTQPVRHPFYVNTGIGMHAGLGQQNYRDEPDKTPSSQIPLTRDKSSTTSRLLTMQEIHSIVDKDTLSELRAIMKDRRDRRKIIQQRHLKKKQKMAEDLVHSIPKLRNEIEQLQLRRLSLRERLPTENVWFTAIEYFRDFQYGLPVLATSQTLVSEFLSATMAPDLDIGARSGIEALTKSWRIFAHAFPGGHIQLESLRQLTSFCLVATTRTSVTLTKQTLQYLFHRLADGSEANSKRRENIFARLLDQRIVMCGSVRFDWDDTSKRVIGLYTHVDMLSPMLTLLGNLEDVSFVFSGALITPDGDFSTKKANEPWRE